MKIKVSEATPSQLDWLVAKCENHQWRCPWMLEKEGFLSWNSYEMAWGNPTPAYSTDWSQGGPILEDEVITISGCECGWVAGYTGTLNSFGPTPLIAAMRCYCCAKLGSEAEVPESLIES